MKIRYFAAKVFIMLISICSINSFCQEKDYGKRDGYDWKKFSELAEIPFSKVDWGNKQEWIDFEAKTRKFYYVLGMFDLQTRIPWKNTYEKYIDEKGEEFYLELEHPFPYFYNTTPQQMLDALDKFYSDYRNMNVLILDAFHIAQMEITGKELKEIDWQTRYYRADESMRMEMSKERYVLDKKKGKIIDKLKDSD